MSRYQFSETLSQEDKSEHFICLMNENFFTITTTTYLLKIEQFGTRPQKYDKCINKFTINVRLDIFISLCIVNL